MVKEFDIVAYDRYGRAPLIVEVKSRFGTSSEWAAKTRRNMLADNRLPHARFFLLALPDRFYLWEGHIDREGPVAPDYVLDSGPILKPYFDDAGIEPSAIQGQSFELLISCWLGDLQRRDGIPEAAGTPEARRVLEEIQEAIRGGRLAHGVGA